MLWTIIVVLLVLWLVGLVSQAGALVHVLLVAAFFLFIINLLTGRRTI